VPRHLVRNLHDVIIMMSHGQLACDNTIAVNTQSRGPWLSEWRNSDVTWTIGLRNGHEHNCIAWKAIETCTKNNDVTITSWPSTVAIASWSVPITGSMPANIKTLPPASEGNHHNQYAGPKPGPRHSGFKTHAILHYNKPDASRGPDTPGKTMQFTVGSSTT
jgi:hypothetical protein